MRVQNAPVGPGPQSGRWFRAAGGRRSAAVLCGLVLVFGVGAAGPAAAEPTSVTMGALEVPVLGQATGLAAGLGNSNAYAVFTVHGVRRVNGATVLYFSVGVPENSAGASDDAFDHAVATWTPGHAEFLIDPAKRVGYSALHGGTGVTGSKRDFTTLKAGDAVVRYAVFPALPAETTQVSVMLGWGQVIPAVPVEDGPLLPAVGAPDGSVVPLGSGWPAIDPAAATGADPAASTFPLNSLTETLDKSATTRRKASATTVDLSSDVLFAVDSAKLSPRASKVVSRMAAMLKKEAAPGATVTIVGHTDSTGSPAHNLTLSRQRAAAVEAALKAQLGNTLRFAVSGKGETQPVASNATAEGRKENRRVSVSYVERAS